MSRLVASGFVHEALSLGEPLDLAGPYLALGVLRGLRPRRILVDVEAWAASTGESLVGVYDGLPDCEWRHLKGLHAKLVVGPRGALVGSANFTGGGMERNVELGVRLDDAEEAQAWFESNWAKAGAFDRKALEGYAASISQTNVSSLRIASSKFRPSERPVLT